MIRINICNIESATWVFSAIEYNEIDMQIKNK